VVYLAVVEALSGFTKLAVLKKLRSELVQDAELVTMFLEEARLAARLHHSNVIQTNEVFEESGEHFIVMEYLEGQPLSALWSDAAPPEEGRPVLGRALHLRILSAAISGLAYAHDVSDFDGRPLALVHRDVSPHNVLVGFDGQVKILDFGIATSSSRSRRTETGVVKGKFRYMAPEQFVGGAIDRRADIFSLGVMIWEAATGRSMWGRSTDAQVMARLLSGELPLRVEGSDLPPGLEALCRKALAHDPAARHATCRELQQELDRAIEELDARSGARADPSEIAAYMAARFGPERARLRQRIADELHGTAVVDRAGRSPLPAEASTAGAQRARSEGRRPGRGALHALGIAALAVAVAGGYLGRSRAAETPAPRAASSASVTAAAPDRAKRPRIAETATLEVAAPSIGAAAARSPIPPSARAADAAAPVASAIHGEAPVALARAVDERASKAASRRELDRENPWR
jgi:serine/threonine-protein kinase